jgi:glucose repression regulatory protein TUP1
MLFSRLCLPVTHSGLQIWEINSRYLRKAFKEQMGLACTLDFSQSGRLLVSASMDNTVRLWSMRYGPIRVLTDDTHTLVDDGSSYSSALFSPDERYVAASHGDGMVRIWNARTGQLVRRVKAHMGWANDIAFMPDGKGLMSAGEDKTLKYLDLSSLYATLLPCER